MMPSFAQEQGKEHNAAHEPRIEIVTQRAHVDEHAHGKEEEGNKQRTANKLHPIHQSALIGDETI